MLNHFFILYNIFYQSFNIKMKIFNNIKLSLLIFSMVTHIEIISSTKDRITFLLENDGWKNLTDVDYVIFRAREYTLQKTLETPITVNNFYTHIRSATIILGCSYANVLKTIFIILDRFLKYCEILMNPENGKKYAYDCTIELINTISNLSYLATLMNGALVSIDKLHRKPMAKHKTLILSSLTAKLRIEEICNLLSYIQVIPSNTDYILNTIQKYLYYRRLNLEDDLKSCKLKCTNLDSLWEILNKQYEFLKEKGSNQEFWTFIKHKINILIHWTNIKKFKNLGFKFDSNTKETYLSNKKKNYETVLHPSTIINYLFKHSGWKNMTDVNYITYSRGHYTLQDIMYSNYRHDKQIRCLTVFLGCSYANILKNIFFILSNFQHHCKYYSSHLENLNNYKYECTIELLKTIPFITSLVKLLGGALEALDESVKSPVENDFIKKYISNTLIKELQNEKILKLLPDLQVNQSNFDETLLEVLSFISEWNEELNKGMIICNINSESLTSFWHNLNIEYYNMQLNGNNIKFYNFLRFKIITISQRAIQEKYVNLGFKSNPYTNKTFIPDPSERENVEDHSIDFTYMLKKENLEEFFEDPTIASTQMQEEEKLYEHFEDRTIASTQMVINENNQEYFEDLTIASTQMMNNENNQEYFEDLTIASTQMMNNENNQEKFNFEETKNQHEPEDISPLLINIPENIRPVNKYL
ncbi:uncharacterized protein LOC126902736 isoform X1 [Daktulosphaira vitifoliae]|uniref:uncharacterized protein LOC126902736 isoform X1 n=1 Tax=Daktulosphaira vitifoliae TaxID=58002 RepID=UPI0021AAFBC1|nr:uncharacterized protein LOC126902736 isoform X1 [Daktulosphaira vitifoliae]